MSESKPLTIHRFLKFGSLENLTKLIMKGQVHMKTLRYFRDLEEKDGRGDSYETLAAHLQPGRFKLSFGTSDGKSMFEVAAEDIAAPFLMHSEGDADLHVFCMTAITTQYLESQTNAGAPIISEQLKSWGKYMLSIKPKPFLDRLTQAATAEGFKIDWGRIEYYDPASYHGETNFFHKRNIYEWQMEARIIADASGKNEHDFFLGSLEDISTLYQFADIEQP